jgi:hypothetical protein
MPFPPSFIPTTVIIPNQVLYPGQTVVPNPAINPTAAVFFPANPIQPQPPFARPGNMMPALGTPRVDVLRQFGQPSVTVITSTGETLYFTGGVTVIIQNGQVAGPR